MPIIHLTTKIKADQKIVFDLARSIDLHKNTMSHTDEKAIAGKTSGLIEKGESVTWEAKHFGITQKLTSFVTDCDSPNFFADEMVSGAFHSFRHEHHFKKERELTIMTDIFDFRSPLGILGRIADRLFLENYMTKLLEKRNREIKEVAESEKWREILETKK